MSVFLSGLTPLHLAAQCGSLEALNCLIALKADNTLKDRRGWLAVHFSAFYGQVSCVQALCRKDPGSLDIYTSAEYVVRIIISVYISVKCSLRLTSTLGVM